MAFVLSGCGGGGGGGGSAAGLSGSVPGPAPQGAVSTTAAPTLRSVVVSPADATVDVGQSQAFTATGIYSDGSRDDLTASASWSSSSGVARMDRGTATGASPGAATIRATANGVNGDASLTVRDLTGIQVTPVDPLSAPGTVRQMTAWGLFSDGSRRSLTEDVTWTSAGAAASVSSAPGSRGRVTVSGSSGQSAVITATHPKGFSDAATLRVGLYFYATLADQNALLGSSVDPATGQRTAVPGSPFATGTNPTGITVAPGGRHVYTVNRDSGDISLFTVDPATGSLAVGGRVAAGTDPLDVTVDPTGRFAYVTQFSGLSGFRIDPVSGALSPMPGSPFPAIGQVAVHPGGGFALVVQYGLNSNLDGTVSVFRIDPSSGALSDKRTYNTGQSGSTRIAIHPSGTLAFVVNAHDPSLSVTTVRIDPTAGTLTMGSTTDVARPGATPNPRDIGISKDGRFVYVADRANAIINQLSVDPGSGALSLVATFGTGMDPCAIALDPTGSFAFTADFGNAPGTGSISELLVNAVTGGLTSRPGSPVVVNARPAAAIFTP